MSTGNPRIQDAASTRCVCRQRKRFGKSLCNACWLALPEAFRFGVAAGLEQELDAVRYRLAVDALRQAGRIA